MRTASPALDRPITESPVQLTCPGIARRSSAARRKRSSELLGGAFRTVHRRLAPPAGSLKMDSLLLFLVNAFQV